MYASICVCVCVCVFAYYIILIRRTGSSPKRYLLPRPPAKYIRVYAARARIAARDDARARQTGAQGGKVHHPPKRIPYRRCRVLRIYLFGRAFVAFRDGEFIGKLLSPVTVPDRRRESIALYTATGAAVVCPATTSPTSLPCDATYRSRNVG